MRWLWGQISASTRMWLKTFTLMQCFYYWMKPLGFLHALRWRRMRRRRRKRRRRIVPVIRYFDSCQKRKGNLIIHFNSQLRPRPYLARPMPETIQIKIPRQVPINTENILRLESYSPNNKPKKNKVTNCSFFIIKRVNQTKNTAVLHFALLSVDNDDFSLNVTTLLILIPSTISLIILTKIRI